MCLRSTLREGFGTSRERILENHDGNCPSPGVLERLLTDDLDKADKAEICDHLLTCKACRLRFEQQLDDETVNDHVRRIMESEGDAFPRSLIDLISELKKFPDARGTTTFFGDGPDRLKNRATPPAAAVDNILDRFRFLSPPQKDDELARLDTFKLLSVLGEGSFGVVFKAFDEHLHRFVAIKAMLPDIARRDKSKERFLREGRALASIQHENVVGVHHVGICNEAPYMVMEFLEGTPLDVHLRKHKKLPLAEVESIGVQIANGLAAAHAKSLIHRDLRIA